MKSNFRIYIYSDSIILSMIPRTILDSIEESIRFKPVTLVTGARQVGKTTLCNHIAEKHGFGYVSLANGSERAIAIQDPEMFLRLHPAPVIIDEVQHAPGLFDVIEGIVDAKKLETGDNAGMYVLTGSQVYKLMEGVTQSMAGRVGIIEMSPLSMSEVLGREEKPFVVDFEKNIRRAMEHVFSVDDVYGMIVRGMYPELYDQPDMRTSKFYSDYVDTYIERDVSEIITLKDKLKFRQFMEYLASITGQELVYDSISKAIGVSIHTIQSWMGVLVAGGIVRLLQPYFERSNVKRIVKRPKIYFCDTGLACYLAKVFDAETLRVGYLGGHMVETFIINEIMKTYTNNTEEAGFYYYRDADKNEIDFLILRNAKLSLIECKAGMTYDSTDVKAFSRLDKSDYEVGPSCLICLTDKAYPLKPGVYALPISSI